MEIILFDAQILKQTTQTNRSGHADCILPKLQSLNQKRPFLLDCGMLCPCCGRVYTDACRVLHSGMTSVHAAARKGRGQSSEQETIKMFSNLPG